MGGMTTGREFGRLALWQGPSPAGDIEAAFADLAAALAGAAAMGARMLVAPEVFLPGYNHPRLAALAQPRGGDWHRRLAALVRARGCGLTLGYAERDGERLFNSAVAFDATGAEVAHYRKLQLFGGREAAIYTPGTSYCTFDLDGTRTALLICYDIEFASHLRALAQGGVRLVLCPTANMEPNGHVSRLVVPAHAVNHGLTLAYANYCGAEGDLTYCGGSVIAGADGAALAAAGPGPALLVADVIPPDPRLLQTQVADYRAVTGSAG
jgi:predicted amidohydrolase